MKVEPLQSHLLAARMFLGNYSPSDPFDDLLTQSTGGGTCLLLGTAYCLGEQKQTSTSSYVAVPIDVIFEYERKILELRRALSHYRDLLSELRSEKPCVEEGFMQDPVVPLNASSINLVNSILAARIPPTATFTDFNIEDE